MTYGLQMSSVPSVDSAIGGLDHVGASTFKCFSYVPVIHLMGLVPSLL